MASLPLPGRSRRPMPDTDARPVFELRLDGVAVDPEHVARYRARLRLPSRATVSAGDLSACTGLPPPPGADDRRAIPVSGDRRSAHRQHDPAASPDPARRDLEPGRTRRRICGRTRAVARSPSPPRAASTAPSSGTARRSSCIASRRPRDDRQRRAPDRAGSRPRPVPRSGGCASDLGRQYAAVSGDRNPIHLFDLTAMPLGFRHHIAHGMWSKARCLAELAEPAARRVRRRGGVQEADQAARQGRDSAPGSDGET